MRRLIVVSLEGLTTAALSCYGSSWNRTLAIDGLVAEGIIWDQMICHHDDPHRVLVDCWRDLLGSPDMASPFPTARLVTDDDELVRELGDSSSDVATWFHKIRHVAPVSQESQKPTSSDEQPPVVSSDFDEATSEPSETRLGALIASATEQIESDSDCQIMWIHSRCLTKHWDAPRSLFPIDDLIDDDEMPTDEMPTDEMLTDDEMGADVVAFVDDSPPPIFDSIDPPQHQCSPEDSIDLPMSWMRTYGCQVRLLDVLLDDLVDVATQQDAVLILLGTSGFSLGQNGWIGHRVGPVRSEGLRVPFIIAGGTAIRSSEVIGTNQMAGLIRNAAIGETLCHPAQWAQRSSDELEPVVVTATDRAEACVRTSGWFYVRDADQQERLFLKPDDAEDFNDVSRLRLDVVDQLNQLASSTKRWNSESSKGSAP